MSDRHPSTSIRRITSRLRVIHPFLFTAWPVLFLLAVNLEEGVAVRDALRPLALALGATAGLLAVATPLLRSAERAGLVVSAVAILFFSYGRVRTMVAGTALDLLARHVVLVTVFIILLAAVVVLALRAGRRFPRLTAGLNLVAAILVAMNVASIAVDRARTGADVRAAQHVVEDVPGASAAADASAKRDIYYLIFDRYAGQRTLEKYYGYDNAELVGFLRDRGFEVPEETFANYPRTTYSLASSLNMEHLKTLRERAGLEVASPQFLYALFDGPRVARFLTSLDYRYINVGTWWEVTKEDPFADVNLQMGSSSEFSSILSGTTVLAPLEEELGVAADLGFPEREQRRIRFQVRAVEQVSKLPEPTFTFAHFLIPHNPLIFDRDGNIIPKGDRVNMPYEERYLEQLRFTNSRIMRMVDTLLGVPEEELPIIVIQSDEGPEPLDAVDDYILAWDEASDAQLEQKLRILNAYHLPGVSDRGIHPTITPVNTFRLVLNLYFDVGLPLLPDRVYARGADVTARLRSG